MKYFLVITGLVLFFPALGQDSTVHIRPSTARYFLEVEDEMYLLREKDNLCQSLVLNLNDQLLVKDQIITTYKNDSTYYNETIATFSEQIRLNKQESKKIITKVKLLAVLEFVVIILLVI